MRLGEVLKEKRVELNLTQEEVGEKLFVTRQTISNWENGKTLPDIDSLIDIATFYDLSLDKVLLKGSDIVEDIKKKEKLTRLYNWLVVPYLIFFLLLFLMYRSIVEDNMTNSLAVSGLLFLTSAIFFFFESQMKEIKGIPAKKWTGKKIVIVIGIIIFGLVAGFLSGYFNVFNV
ncbi:helix-turn-helix domain-containing protein [Vagococcus fluvialis]|uniref:helix-turn-helix domain-containing protein n=1 Tax=Vagococcus fluvialis TaxID=2738 RepID=UPI001A8CBC17|nr:helix-turn-helix transcriptional regulator [Vagococcus fluvialis]MBO0438682.1 helix-turn-helix transcriptional regulator [Vagococcus fluvialis]